MLNEIGAVKKKLMEAISQLCEVSWIFVKDPERDFTKKRKLPFDKVISFLLAMEGGTLTTELLKYFGCSPNIATTAALVQQRGKIDASAFFTKTPSKQLPVLEVSLFGCCLFTDYAINLMTLSVWMVIFFSGKLHRFRYRRTNYLNQYLP